MLLLSVIIEVICIICAVWITALYLENNELKRELKLSDIYIDRLIEELAKKE